MKKKNNLSLLKLPVFLFCALLTVCLQYCKSDTNKEKEDAAASRVEEAHNDINTEPFIKNPCPGIDVPYASYEINTEQGGVLQYSTGSSLTFKPNSFIDQSGNPVNGEITILYREFHNPYDFFISGIPMEYDTLGKKYYFESAGMMEILAFKNGEPVFIDPKNPVKVELKSYYASADYNLYYLDTINKKWDYKGKEQLVEKAVEKNAGSKIEVEPKKVSGDLQPIEPKKANLLKNRFNVDVNVEQFPELKFYKDVLFELSDLNKNFDPKLYNVTWDDAQLSKSNIEGNYSLKLFRGDTSFTFAVYPVFEGASFEKAKKEFDQHLKNYTASMNKENKTQAPKSANQAPISLTSFSPDNKTTQDISRVFEINRFGVWNCDKFRDLPKGEDVEGVYSDNHNASLEFLSLYLVDKSKNALFNISSLKKWRYNPKSENLLWGVTKNNRIAVFSPSQFKKLKKSEGQCHFNMSVSDNVAALKEIKNFLGI